MTRLKYERKIRRLSQTRLARDARIHQPVLSQIERCRLVPTIEQLARLSVALGIPSDDLLKEVVVVEARTA